MSTSSLLPLSPSLPSSFPPSPSHALPLLCVLVLRPQHPADGSGSQQILVLGCLGHQDIGGAPLVWVAEGGQENMWVWVCIRVFMSIQSFIHSLFYKWSLNTYWVPSIGLGPRDSMLSKTDSGPALGTNIQAGRPDNKQQTGKYTWGHRLRCTLSRDN